MPPICICLGGDVMTGRGIDQILPHPSSRELFEPYVHDAREYVRIAEAAHGPIPRPVPTDYIWGDALAVLRDAGTDVRIVNLETSITTSDDHWPGKGIHYRMHPANVGCLTAAGIDCCCLANNHVLDWGYDGLGETVRALDAAGLRHAGAGADAAAAQAPVTIDVAGRGKVLVISVGSTTSGIPPSWAATDDRPGVDLLEDLSEKTARRLATRITRDRRPGDVAIISIHWGGNWGYEVPREQIAFAHGLIDGGVDIVHGHSSHHVKGIEVYRDRLILYGCGDLLTDYEGIHGHEAYRGQLGLLYLADVDPEQGRVVGVRLVPTQVRNFRLKHPSDEDGAWLCATLNREGKPLGTSAHVEDDGRIELQWR